MARLVVDGRHESLLVARYLVAHMVPFEFSPLPFDKFEFAAKLEYTTVLRALARGGAQLSIDERV